MTFFARNSSNSSLQKLLPLSLTIVVGRPWIANVHRSFSIFTLDVATIVGCTSSHFEYASTMMRNKNGPRMDQHSQYEFFPMVGLARLTDAISIYCSCCTFVLCLPDHYPCSATTRSFLLDFLSCIFLVGFM
jgi:hypothetical protein